MLLLLISCFSFILLSKSLSSKHQHHHRERRLFPPWDEAFTTTFMTSWFQKGTLQIFTSTTPLKKLKPKAKNLVWSSSTENQKEDHNKTTPSPSLLDLPELVLDCILDRLQPAELCAMSGVCSSLRERCVSDDVWEKRMKGKWGKVIGDAAYREWQWYIALKNRSNLLNNQRNQSNFSFESVAKIWPFLSWFNIKPRAEKELKNGGLAVDSIMAWYLALETGRFSFPAQVYNRENGHAGFLLSCYDAKLSYDSKTDTFQARYSPHGRRTTEENISWDRLRAPPVDTCSYDLHISDSLFELKPGDHIEIQWRRNREFPYGWWYGVVDHMESCNGNENHCRCQDTDTVMLEFKQYPSSSRWRKQRNHYYKQPLFDFLCLLAFAQEMSSLISGVKGTAQSLTALRRPWRDFFDISAVDLPSSTSDATTRIAQNLTHFRLNYTLILLLILFLSLIYHPLSLLTFLVILLAWFFLYFARDREEPVVIFGFFIDDRIVIAALFGLTVAGLVLTGVWVNVLVALAVGVGFVILHAALRSTDDLVMDDLESPYGHVLAGGDDELDSPRGDYSGI